MGRSLIGERSRVRVLQEAGPREAPDLPKLGWLGSLLLCHLAQRAVLDSIEGDFWEKGSACRVRLLRERSFVGP